MFRFALSLIVGLSTGAAIAQAAEKLEVSKEQWDQLADQQKQSIQNLLEQSFPGAGYTIAAVPGAAGVAASPGNPFCRGFCDFSSAILKIGCQSVPGGALASVLCTGLADKAKDACYKGCNK